MDSQLAIIATYLMVLLLSLFCVTFLLVRSWRRLI